MATREIAYSQTDIVYLAFSFRCTNFLSIGVPAMLAIRAAASLSWQWLSTESVLSMASFLLSACPQFE